MGSSAVRLVSAQHTVGVQVVCSVCKICRLRSYVLSGHFSVKIPRAESYVPTTLTRREVLYATRSLRAKAFRSAQKSCAKARLAARGTRNDPTRGGAPKPADFSTRKIITNRSPFAVRRNSLSFWRAFRLTYTVNLIVKFDDHFCYNYISICISYTIYI